MSSVPAERHAALLRQQTALARFGELALRSEDLDEILHEACRLVAEALGTPLAKVLELEPDGASLLVRAGIGWRPGVVGGVRLAADEGSSEGHAVRTGKPVVSPDVATETRFSVPDFLREHGVRALVNTVILGTAGGQPYGVLQVDTCVPRQFDDHDIAFLQTYANLLGAAVGRLRVLVAARERERFALGVLAASPDCLKVLEADGTLRFMNERGLRLNEVSDPDAVLGHDWVGLWPPEERDKVEAAIAGGLAGGTTRIEGFCPTLRGTPKWWEVSFSALPPVQGEPPRLVAISRDITERRQAEAARQEAQARLHAVFDAVPVGIMVAEAPSGRVVAGNRRAEQLFRRPLTDRPDAAEGGGAVEGWGAVEAWRHADGKPVLPGESPLLRAMTGEERPTLEVQHGSQEDGGHGWLGLTAAPLRDPAGAVTGAILIGQDISLQKQAEAVLRHSNAALQDQVASRTEALDESNRSLLAAMGGRQQAEGQVRQLQKMEAVGQLAGGVAHDFNNMLAVVISGLSLVQRRLARGDTEVGRFIDAAMDGAQRAGTLTQRLLAFSRPELPLPTSLDTNRLVGGMDELLRRTLGDDVQLRTVLAPGLWQTHADASELENAVLNLAVNARDAMPDGGWLTIETANAEFDLARTGEPGAQEEGAQEEGACEGRAQQEGAPGEGMAPGQYVVVTVSDTGCGMPPDVIAQVFNPFFTTKPAGKGTGLGLSQVYRFARQAGGDVRIASRPGEGTAVRIHLPRFHGPALVAGAWATPSAEPVAETRGELVLVVEDEIRVRHLTVAALQELGYTVIHADGAAAALRQLDANPGVRVLFTDLVMPDVNGRRLAEEAQRRCPGLKVLFTTGYTRGAVLQDGLLEAGVPVLPKPFSLGQLAVEMRRVLG